MQDVINTSGAITDRVIFNAFGQKELADTGTPSLYGFEGMMQGVASTPSGIFALDYDNARWYDPNSEDFISQDPKGVKGGSTNLYSFVNNDPVINADPTGMMFLTGIAQQTLEQEAYPNPLFSTSSVLDQEAQTLTSERMPMLDVSIPASSGGGDLPEWVASVNSELPPVSSPDLSPPPDLEQQTASEYSDILATNANGPTPGAVQYTDEGSTRAYWDAFFGGEPAGQVALNPTVQKISTGARYVGVGALTLASGGLTAGAVGGLEIGGATGAILSGAAGGGASGFTGSVLSQATQNNTFNLSQVNLTQAAEATGIGALTGGVAGGSLYGAGQLLAAQNGLTSLNILNPTFEPDPVAIFQNHVNAVNDALTADPTLARSFLSPAEYAQYQTPGGYAINYGKAIENGVAESIQNNPLSDSLFERVGGPNDPDFVGRANTVADPYQFDITTPGQVDTHLARPYGPDTNIITYQRAP